MAKEKKDKFYGAEKEQKRLFKKKRAGQVLSENEVQDIRAGRKKLRREMRAMGIRSRKEFELTASSLGLYFDKTGLLALLWWFRGKGLVSTLASLALLGGAFYGLSYVTQMRGHFTISMDGRMFTNGFVLSETVGFENPTTYLFAEPAVDVPCISISMIPEDVDQHDGNHSETYFAYTFYVRNEGEETVGYDWTLRIRNEAQNLSHATWIMVFEDGEMEFFAKADENGEIAALPALDDNTRGYLGAPLKEFAADPDQYQLIYSGGTVEYYRVLPKDWESDTVITTRTQTEVEPMEVHKYTVVMWLEGDDPDCTDDLIGGYMGVEVYMQLIEEMG